MTPYGLTTEQRTEPLGLGENRPRLSWKLRSARPCSRATRYHWRVETWDETGAKSGAAHTWFETGLVHRDAGCTAVLEIPTPDPESVLLDGVPVGATVRLTSGRFTFTATSY
jgi:hypothetical protein